MQSTDPSSEKSLATDLAVLVLLNRRYREPYSLLGRALIENDSVPQNAVAQENRCIVEKHQVEVRARYLATEPTREPPYHLAPAIGCCQQGIVHKDRNIEVARI